MPKWNGGACPVHPDTVVRFMIRACENGGYRPYGYPTAPAGKLRWSHDGGPGDIVFYKVEDGR